jgi:tripartite-type tricarboxylate transporter receptor subunit TctC
MSRRSSFTVLALALLAPGAAHAQAYPAKPVRIVVPFPLGGRAGSRRRFCIWGGDGALPPGFWHRMSQWFAIALIALAPPCASPAYSQNYPAKPVRVIVPFPPGGVADIFARILGQKLTVMLGQPFIVDNRGGASGNIGVDNVAKSPPDGYTLLITSSTLAINPGLYPKLPFDVRRDLAPITLIASLPNILCVHPSLPVKSVKELIALTKARPGQLNFASSSSGTASHLSGELFKSIAGVDITHVPYKGGGPMLTALLSGEVTIGFLTPVNALPQIKAGRFRALGVTSRQRLQVVSELPTMIEAGLKDFEAIQWFAALAAAGTPKDIVTRLNAEIAKALKLPDVRERAAAEGAELVGTSPEALAAFLDAEINKWAKVIKISGAKPD